MNKLLTLLTALFFMQTIVVHSQQKAPLTSSVEGMRPLEMKISDDGKHIIAAYNSCTVVWDISKREILRRIPRYLSYYHHSYNLTIRALNHDGSLLAVGDDQVLSLYNTENNKIIKQLTVLEHRKDPNTTDDYGFSTDIGWKHEYFKHIYFTPDKKNIIVISDEDKIRYVDLVKDTVSLVNVSNDVDFPRPSAQGDILDLNISQGRVITRDNFNIIIFNLFSGKKEGEIPLKYNNMNIYPISFSLNDDKYKNSIFLAGNDDYEDYLFVCDIENRKILNGRKIDGKAHMVQLTAEENIVVLARDDSICLYNYQTETEIVRLIAYEEPKKPFTLQNEDIRKKPVLKTVQLGSYLSFNSALQLINDIEGEGFKPFIERAKINDKTFWRVVINRVFEDEVTTLCGLLKDAGFTSIWLRPDNSE